MSWHFLQEQEAASWEGNSLDGAPSALLNLIPIAGGYCLRVNETESLSRSPFGMTCGRSTGRFGADVLTSSQADSLASLSLAPAVDGGLPSTYGQRCDGSSKKSRRLLSSQKTSREAQSIEPHAIWLPTGSAFVPREFPPPAWLPRTDEPGSGWLPTPTATANHECVSMLKWPNHRLLRQVTGGLSIGPTYWEWMMGFPIGWLRCQPLGTLRFQWWLRSHGER